MAEKSQIERASVLDRHLADERRLSEALEVADLGTIPVLRQYTDKLMGKHGQFMDYFYPWEYIYLRTNNFEKFSDRCSKTNKYFVKKKHLYEFTNDMSEPSSNNEDRPPPSEELFFDSDAMNPYDEIMKRVKYEPRFTSLQRSLLHDLGRYVIFEHDDLETMEKKRQRRLQLVREYCKELKRKRYAKAFRRLTKCRAKNLELEQETMELMERELVDKNLFRLDYYAKDEPAEFKNILLAMRRNAITKKYLRYKTDPNYRESLRNRIYYNVNLDPPGTAMHELWAEDETPVAEDYFHKQSVNNPPVEHTDDSYHTRTTIPSSTHSRSREKIQIDLLPKPNTGSRDKNISVDPLLIDPPRANHHKRQRPRARRSHRIDSRGDIHHQFGHRSVSFRDSQQRLHDYGYLNESTQFLYRRPPLEQLRSHHHRDEHSQPQHTEKRESKSYDQLLKSVRRARRHARELPLIAETTDHPVHGGRNDRRGGDRHYRRKSEQHVFDPEAEIKNMKSQKYQHHCGGVPEPVAVPQSFDENHAPLISSNNVPLEQLQQPHIRKKSRSRATRQSSLATAPLQAPIECRTKNYISNTADTTKPSDASPSVAHDETRAPYLEDCVDDSLISLPKIRRHTPFVKKTVRPKHDSLQQMPMEVQQPAAANYYEQDREAPNSNKDLTKEQKTEMLENELNQLMRSKRVRGIRRNFETIDGDPMTHCTRLFNLMTSKMLK